MCCLRKPPGGGRSSIKPVAAGLGHGEPSLLGSCCCIVKQNSSIVIVILCDVFVSRFADVWEVKRNELQLTDILGVGQFGVRRSVCEANRYLSIGQLVFRLCVIRCY